MSAATTFGALAPGARFRLNPGGNVWSKTMRSLCDGPGVGSGYAIADDRPVYPLTDADYLEHLRGQIRAECISWGELADLQDMAELIDPGDVELLEWAGVPEHAEERAGRAMTGMPAALIAAVKESRDRESSAGDRAASSRIQRGDLRFANGLAGSDAEPRLVLVLSVDGRLEFAEVLLVHAAVEMACDVDAIVPVAVSGAPYAVVVETDLRGAVWTLQLSPEVGHLDETVITALAPGHEVSTAGPASGVSHGIRLAGPVDPRWGFKADEGAAFRSLTRDCTDALLDEGEWLVAPELLRPDRGDLPMTTFTPSTAADALRLAEPSPSPAARRWAERIDSGTFEHGHVRSFAGLVARMAEGIEYRGDGYVAGRPTTLRPDEAVFLVNAIASAPVDIPDELTETGLRWLHKHAAKRLPGFPVERLDSFVRFTYAGEHAPVNDWHSVPVWRVHFSDGGPFLTYAVTSARVGGLTGQAETPGNWHEGAW